MPEETLIALAGSGITQDGQVEWAGLLLGDDTPYAGRVLGGWDSLPDTDSSSVLRSGGHGAYLGDLWAGQRVVTLSFEIVPPALDPDGQWRQYLADLRAVTGIRSDEQALTVRLAGQTLLVWGRVTHRTIPGDQAYMLGYPTGEIEWTCSDPRRYDPTEQVLSTGLPVPEAGLDWLGGGSTGTQVLSASQQAGTADANGWYTVQGTTLNSSGSTETVTITAASTAAPAMIAWYGPLADWKGFPVTPGQTVQFTSTQPPAGATVLLHWVDAAGGYVGETAAVSGSITALAPAGTVYALPMMQWTALPSPATQPVGGSRMVVTAAGSGGTGLDWPLAWGTAGSTGNLTAVNAGDAPADPLIEVRGPVVRPSLTDTATGRVLEYDITLTATDVLTVDTGAGTVVLNGSADRLYTATSRSWPEEAFQLPPGETPLAFRQAPGMADPAARATVRFRSAHW